MSGNQMILLGGNPQQAAVDPYFYSVTSLLHGDGTNGGQNNTFLDSSTNNFTITRNGNTTQGSFSPFSQTGWSNFFDGTGDYLTTNATQAIPATGDFTVDGWIWCNSYANGPSIISQGTAGTSGRTVIYITTAGKLALQITSTINEFGSAIPTNQWVYFAITRTGSTVTAYINGSSVGTATNSGSIQNTTLTIGGEWNGDPYRWIGYLSNIRVSNIVRTITAAPTAPFTSDANTVVLTCQSNRFLDASSNNFTITVNGNTSVQPFSPFNPTTAYSTSAVGGSGYFDGSGDYLSIANNAAFDLGTGDCTIECWVYPTSYASTRAIFNCFNSGASAGYSFALTTSGFITVEATSGGYQQLTSTNNAVPLNAWSFISFTRTSSTNRIFVNGVSCSLTGTLSNALDTGSQTIRIGQSGFGGGSNNFLGYITNLRVLKGTGGTTSTVPTAPLSSIANTQLLTNFTNGAIFDNAAVADYETVGNAQISTSVKKYGTGSIAFDGTGDKLVTPFFPWLQMGSSDWTIEMWVYLNSAPGGGSYYGLYANRASTAAYSPIAIFVNSSRQIEAYFSTSGSSWTSTLTTGQTIPTTTWTHVAVVKIGTLVKVYFNGNGDGSTATISGSLFTNTAQLWVGGENGGNDLNGYIDDFRISKGVARYPYNFTPPTAEFPNIGGTVTLTADPYFDYTTLLLPGNGTNGAQNNTFLDSSTNAFSITRNGNTTQGTFSPFSQTGWGNYFDGSGDDLSLASNAAFAPGTGDFTFEAWINPTSLSATFAPIFVVAATGGLWVGKNGSNFVVRAFSVADQLQVATLPPTNQWTHVAVTRSGTTLQMFYNGLLVGSTTNSYNFAQGALYIGSDNSANYHTGYISNLRLVKGTAVYTSNFTPPTTPLTAITNTSLLTCQSNRFIDNSTNALTITPNGGVSVQAFSPFNPTASWSAATYGGSGYFDGSGDYLTTTGTSSFNGSTGNWTFEAWCYFNNASNNDVLINGIGAGGDRFYILWVASIFYLGDGVQNTIVAGSSKPINQWFHIAVVKNGSTYTAYLNGVSIGTSTTALANTAITTFEICGRTSQSWFTSGYLANFRYSQSAIYTTTFTPPTSLVSGGALLLNFTNAGIYDATSKNDLETVGNAQISTTQSKFGGSSMYFDGTGDWLLSTASPNLALGSGDFTIEAWVRRSTPGSGAGVVLQMSDGTDSYSLLFGYISSSNYVVYISSNGSSWDIASAQVLGAIENDVWIHYALTRYGSTFRTFRNGIQQATWTSSSSIYQATNQVTVGRAQGTHNYVGYMQDVRVTKGIARYTSNFTPPTTAFLTL